MAKKKKNFKTKVTPKVQAKFAYIDKPDKFKPQPGTELEQYKCDVLLNPEKESHKELIDDIDKMVEKQWEKVTKNMGKRTIKQKTKRSPIVDDMDKDKNATGYLLLRTKSKFQPPVVDSKNNNISNNMPKIMGGSTVRLKITLIPYDVAGNIGVTARLSGVQLIELQQGFDNTNVTGDKLGFEEEDGFVKTEDETFEEADDEDLDKAKDF